MGEVNRDLLWMQWLARNGYGVDFAFDEAPPVPLEHYARVLRDAEGGSEDVEAWAWMVEQETGPWRTKAER